jgi:3-hydroxyisobutyrate dehydrogenase-like beta-hydroxyacid dehydrogenase
LARSKTPNAAQCQQFYQAATDLGIVHKDWIQLISCQGKAPPDAE